MTIYTLDHFTPHVGQDFTIPNPDGSPYRVRLIAAIPLSDFPFPGQVRAPFSLVFSGPGPYPLDQGTYRLTHDAMGEIQIGFTPIDRQGDEFHYQAVFN